MTVEAKLKGSPKFPLRLMPSVRRTAEAFSEKEGASLNQFLDLAYAEKLVHLEHDECVHGRKQPTQGLVNKALQILEKASHRKVEQDDELPEGYKSVRRRKHA